MHEPRESWLCPTVYKPWPSRPSEVCTPLKDVPEDRTAPCIVPLHQRQRPSAVLPSLQRPMTAPMAGQKSVGGKGSLVGNEINLVTSVQP